MGKNSLKKTISLLQVACYLSKVFFEIGGFREDFFIDNVDLEYSLRLRKHGKVSLISKKEGMKHKVGAPKINNIFGINLVSTNHSRIRRYYMSRNHVIMSKEYLFLFPYFIVKLNYFFFLSLLKIVLVDDDKKAKISASFKGIIDGILYSSKSKSWQTIFYKLKTHPDDYWFRIY